MHCIRLTFTFQESYNQSSSYEARVRPDSVLISTAYCEARIRPDNSIKHREAWIRPDSGLSLRYEAQIRPHNSLIPRKP